MSAIGDLRAAIKVALVDGLGDDVEVIDFEAPMFDSPSVVIANGDPWVAQVDEEDAGFCIRIVRHRLLFVLSDRMDAEAQEQFEEWADDVPALLSSVVAPSGFGAPTATTIGPPQQITVGDKGYRAMFVDVETPQHF